jgi:hypothetical protein
LYVPLLLLLLLLLALRMHIVPALFLPVSLQQTGVLRNASAAWLLDWHSIHPPTHNSTPNT